MAKNLKKFVNPKFTRTVDLELLSRLFERHRDAVTGLDLDMFHDRAAHDAARSAVHDFFAGPEENYPEGLVADLHRIAELGNAEGLDIILQQAERLGTPLIATTTDDEPESRQDPKHVALRVFLDHPDVFNASSDMLALLARTSLAEFGGQDEGIEASMNHPLKTAFETAAAEMFQRDFRSNYCRVGWYDDADELVLVIEHGTLIRTMDVLEKDQKRVIPIRSITHAVLSYDATAGRLKVGGVAKARQADLAELFADKILGRPGFFVGAHAQDLYTLEPLQRTGFGFAFNHDFDPGIQQVQITEVQIDRVGVDAKTGKTRTFHSHVTRAGRGNALARLGEMMRGSRLTPDWRFNHIVIRVHFATGGKSAKKVTVKLKPPSQAIFKRQQFEGRIMTLLRRNGLLNDRDTTQVAAAAE
jgi:hypothetical protein